MLITKQKHTKAINCCTRPLKEIRNWYGHNSRHKILYAPKVTSGTSCGATLVANNIYMKD